MSALGLLDIVTSGAAGGLLGVTGAIVQKFLDNKSADKQAQLELQKLSLELTHKEAIAKLGISEKEYDTLAKSIDSDRATYSAPESAGFLGQLVDFIRGITRPALTAYLILFHSVMLGYLVSNYKLTLTAEQAFEICQAIITCLLGCTTLALGWWFGARKSN